MMRDDVISFFPGNYDTMIRYWYVVYVQYQYNTPFSITLTSSTVMLEDAL